MFSLDEIFQGVVNFTTLYWWLVVFVVGYLASNQVWSNFSTDIFVERFQLTAVLAGRLNSIPTTIGVILCPLLGVYIDIYGNTKKLLLVGSILLLIGHVSLSFSARRKFLRHLLSNRNFRVYSTSFFIIYLIGILSTKFFVLCEIILGLGVGIVQSALWPTLARAVPPRLVGTGMGIVTAVSNCAMVVFPLITGKFLFACFICL